MRPSAGFSPVYIVFAVTEKLLPDPWDHVAVIAVMLSTVGTLETSILQFTRTMFSMGRDNALHQRYARLHQTYRTPWVPTVLIIVLGRQGAKCDLIAPDLETSEV